MHPRIEEAVQYLETQRAALRDAVELVPHGLRERQPGPDRWSVAQVLQHLAIIEKRIGRGLTKWVADARASGLGPELETTSILDSLDIAKILDRSRRATAPEGVRPQTDLDAASAWEALERSRETLRAAILAGDGFALGEVIQPHPALGPINLYQWILFVGSHEARHTAQVREIAEELNAESTSARGAS